MKKQTNKPIIAVDYDGVLNQYRGWQGENNLPAPQKGVEYFLRKLDEKFDVVIFTCRDNNKVTSWLEKYGLDKYIVAVTMNKPKAFAYVDDRAINYGGKYSEVLEKLENFKTWWEE